MGNAHVTVLYFCVATVLVVRAVERVVVPPTATAIQAVHGGPEVKRGIPH